MTRRKCSDEDQALIHEEVERYANEFHEMIGRHVAELKELRQQHDRALRQIPGYPAWAGWKAIHK